MGMTIELCSVPYFYYHYRGCGLSQQGDAQITSDDTADDDGAIASPTASMGGPLLTVRLRKKVCCAT